MAKKRRRKKKIKLWKFGLFVLLLIAGFFGTIRLISSIGSHSVVSESDTPKTTSVNREKFIKEIAPHAVELSQAYGVMPSIIIGQAVLESNFGQSELAAKYNNLFGIKAYGDVPKIKLDTKEYVDDEWITIKGEFRVYGSWRESLDSHTQLFVNGVDWNPQLYRGVFTATNFEEAAEAIQEAGYATDPTYAEKLIAVIKQYHLNSYDLNQ
ncbi:MAG: glycoside hydrolase family 73 protein [Lactobacillales bacterium]|jgi:flagellum-specific peptidoglycan hydrolase FlgJ|nr:glycoside hydrolase family 73 protein [Lactobacillales bacterium]